MNKTKYPRLHIDKDLLRVRNDTDEALRYIYRQYRMPFIQWAIKNFTIDESSATDVFQEVVVAFYKNVTSLKLQKLDASLKSYLFAIGKNILLNRNRQLKKRNELQVEDWNSLNLGEWDMDNSALFEKSMKEERIVSSFALLGDKCKQLLTFFYFQGLAHKDIVERLGYNSVEVSRSMKRKCLKQLKSIVLKSS